MSSPPWTGIVILASASVGYAALLGLVRRADSAYPSTNPNESRWWFGYSRDLSNLAGVLVFSLGFIGLGFPGPVALLAGFAVALFAYAIDFLLARVARARASGIILALLTVILVTVLATWRQQIQASLERLVEVVF
ncbi:MAG: hypothetical protein V2A73_17690 [Pseudomonadota bacterium]